MTDPSLSPSVEAQEAAEVCMVQTGNLRLALTAAYRIDGPKAYPEGERVEASARRLIAAIDAPSTGEKPIETQAALDALRAILAASPIRGEEQNA